jgi:CIC family chloride channel protein
MESDGSSVKRIASYIRRKVTAYETVNGLVLSILAGVITGFGAIAFRWMVDAVQLVFFGGGAEILFFLGRYYIILIPAVGGLLVGTLLHFVTREAKGHGVPEVMEAVALRGGYIEPKVSLLKTLASSICIGTGGSVGFVGPIVYIGSSLGSFLGQRLHVSEDWVRTLVTCGAAGGISATFNAPIGGVFFALEAIQGRFTTLKFGYVVISAVIADVLSRIFLGNKPFLGTVSYSMVSYWTYLIPIWVYWLPLSLLSL